MKGLYVHIPFCVKKCKYCNFNSFSTAEENKDAYLAALFKEAEKYRGTVCDTVFIGGGTPTALSTEQTAKLLKKINECFLPTSDAEFSSEANPKTVDMEKLTVMRENGVNRISFGVQSFSDTELAAIGRIHTADDAAESFRMARAAGFDNISMDLMIGIPHQTMESLAENIKIAAELEPEHISCYSLIVEEGTPLYGEYVSGKAVLPNDDYQRDMYDAAVAELKKYGYARYEISNFAKPGRMSRHNMKYWRCEEYLGVGLSAHSYLNGVRRANTDSFASYLKGDYFGGENIYLSKEDMMSEFMFMGLRMSCGVSAKEFYERFGTDIRSIFGKTLSKFIKMGMIKEENERFALTDTAVPVSNAVMCEFIL